ncbi:hypothetical protein N7492_006945 [Penicillium capsulatum]|uniref:Multicopper oxidase n=1 Tax=Penicillium capsulatum TaxID=69766 RepID=A0A9W9LLC9_9EURO|nr:hypothetical protein N7492_006945 [Penicillium capsulatum]KAJ6116778.1 hypothetical protein N7512_006503 [Penicillium capsulatum]
MKLAVLLSSLGLAAALGGPSSTTGQIAPTKRFELNATWESWAADGVQRKQTLINGQFPGPPLILDEGDNVEVTVNNFMPFNTTIHYHGIEQSGTPWSDGMPGVSQRPIAPGGKFVYTFKVEQYGTYWPRKNPENLARLITNDTREHDQMYKAIKSPTLVTLSDWFHDTSLSLRKISLDANIDALCADSVLINGKGKVNCRDPGYLKSTFPASMKSVLQGMNLTAKGCLPLQNTYAQTTFPHKLDKVPKSLFDECKATNAEEAVINVDSQSGWTSLNFVASAAISALIVSINDHDLWVYEIDGLYIKPTKVDALTLNNGGRYSCLVKLNQTPGDYPITVANAGLNQKIAGYATFSYLHGDTSVSSHPSINYGGVGTGKDVISFDETTIDMLVPSQPKAHPDETFVLTTDRIQHAWKWSLNGNHSYGLALEDMKPLLWQPSSAVDSPLVISTRNNTWVDIIFALSGNASTLQPSHPMHKHSNRVYVLVSRISFVSMPPRRFEVNFLTMFQGSGTGPFEWKSVAEAAKAVPDNFNLVNPPIRDTFTTLPAYKGQSWLAVRYHVRNPGAFFLHCHLNPHLTGGMGLAILDGVDHWPKVPRQYGPHGQ